jgi:1-acyl-sn-glycerol-3-phosphate acyltransferase
MSEPSNIAESPARDEERANQLLDVLRELALELHPGRRAVLRLGLSDRLDAGFGIDSLARLELLLRLEHAFAVGLAEELLMEAETPADLLALIGAAGPTAERPITAPRAPRLGEVEPAPVEAETLIDVLRYHVETHGDRPHIHLLTAAPEPEILTYRDLWNGAWEIAAGLRARDVAPGQAVALMMPTGADFFHVFTGVLLAGAVPVPIYPPVRRTQIEDHLRRQAAILRNAEVTVLATTPEARLFGQLIRAQVETLRVVATSDELRAAGAAQIWPGVAPDSTALLQYTSGSTGDPKGAVLSHANLIANIRGLGEVLHVTPRDVVVSWLPLYHDMGLIGNWLGSLCYACPFFVMPPLHFLARPERWLWAIDHHRATLSAAPNFAYEICVDRVRDRDIEGLDLSSWRMAANGAEPVSLRTIERFAARYEKYGYRREIMTPMYGLAESAVALTLPPLERGPRVDRIARGALAANGRAVAAADDDTNPIELLSCGIPLPGHEVRVVDPAGRELGEREQGGIQFRGASATAGYLRNPQKTAELFDGDWLNTGDLGYMADGELFVTGRSKDIIIRAGRNLYPEEMENAVGDLEGARKGRIAVFPSLDEKTGTEKLIVLAETRLRKPARRAALVEEIRELVTSLAEIPPDDVVLAAPGAVLKTANGKIRRAACRALYERGRIGRPPPALWRQFLGLMQASVGPELRRAVRGFRALAYAAYFQLVYRFLAVFVWLVIAILPGLTNRRRLFKWSTALIARLFGIGPEVRGLENLPANEPCILVVNHQSFLDGLIMAAILPPTIAFSAKRELVGSPVAGFFLERLGTIFVERFDPAAGVEDTRRLVECVKAGTTLVVFPEGTFDRRPGLRSFHMGAFVVAVEAGVPVVPVAIRGTRSILRADTLFARRGRAGIIVRPPLRPEGEGWRAALELRARARAEILPNCGEPDLVHEPTRLETG